MTLIFVVLGVALLMLAALIVFAIDERRQWLPRLWRLVMGTLVASALAGALSVAVGVASCNDLEKYSFLWYAYGCFLFESSS